MYLQCQHVTIPESNHGVNHFIFCLDECNTVPCWMMYQSEAAKVEFLCCANVCFQLVNGVNFCGNVHKSKDYTKAPHKFTDRKFETETLK